MDEFRVERAVGAAGYPPTGSSTDEHLVEVLHVTTLELLTVLQDPACADPEHLMWGVMGLLDRLTKVLAYRAAETLRTGELPDLPAVDPLDAAVWGDYVARTWPGRLDIYAELPPANQAIDSQSWEKALVAGADLEQALLQDIGFVFEDRADGSYAFLRRVADHHLHLRLERAMAQQQLFEAQHTAADGGS